MAGAMLHRLIGTQITKASPTGGTQNDGVFGVDPPVPEKIRNPRVLVLGGTGRVGGSTALALSKLCPDMKIVLGGRNSEKGEAMVGKLGKDRSQFVRLDINDVQSLQATLKDMDLVVHAAGPFQEVDKCTVLEAAINTKTAYIDVCDDMKYAFRAKSLKDEAIAANVPAIVTGGLYPGLSNVMAAELVRAARTGGRGEPERLRYSYYTAGTGGTGEAILAATFLVLGDEVVTYNKGRKVRRKAFSGKLNVDFGFGIGSRNVYLLNLPEVRSAHEFLRVPSVSARFGTSPFLWNWGMVALSAIFPREFLRNKDRVRHLVRWIDPTVRAFDGFVGERVAVRVDLKCDDGRTGAATYSHRSLSESVGTAVAAFALAILQGSTRPGVWFPEEPEGVPIKARENFLKLVTQGAINFEMDKPQWRGGGDPREIGLCGRIVALTQLIQKFKI